jgi:hypothetical protein
MAPFAALPRLQELLKGPMDTPFKITVRRLTPEKRLRGRKEGYRPFLKELRELGVSRIVLDCHWSKVSAILHQVSSSFPMHASLLPSSSLSVD